MPSSLSERVNTPISTAELDRRRTAIRAGMREAGIDVLIAQNNNDHLGGNVRYLIDFPASYGYTMTAIMPREDAITVVRHGPFGGDNEVTDDDPILHGVRRVLTTAMFASVTYCRDYEAQLIAKALAPYSRSRIGLAGHYQISAAILDYLRGELPDAEFVEACEIVDEVRMIKSEEEFELIRRTALLQDAAMEAAFKAVEPGMRDSDVAAVAQCHVQQGQGEQGIFLSASMKVGEPVMFGPRHMQNRVMDDGDFYALLVETSGPGGLYTELGRSCILGSANDEMLEEFQFVLEARRACLDTMRPGVPCADVWEQYNTYMRDRGRPEEARLHCHGQGYDLVERPLIRFDEPAAIALDMNITCHPQYPRAGVFSWACDNYRIGAEGPHERLHRFPEKITEL
jgi:Xaa-Pro aminopeptidase